MWTLVGAGLKNLDESIQSMSVVMPRNVKWIKEKAAKFDPKENVVYTDTDRQVKELLYSKFNFFKKYLLDMRIFIIIIIIFRK